MICIYKKTNTNYDSNGDAVLFPKNAKVKHVAAGSYELSITLPRDPDGKWKLAEPGAVIRSPVPEERIENAFAGYDADVYKTTTRADLREEPEEPTTITYSTWSIGTNYSVGDKVTWNNKNYQCTYFDETSTWANISPDKCSWWRQISRGTPGGAVLVTLETGKELYFVLDYNATWYKMSTYYGIIGYIKKSQVTYDRHISPSEQKPRIITTQLFRITKPAVETKNNTITVTARHVSYDLDGNLVKDVKLTQASPAMAIGRIAEGLMLPYKGTIATNLQNLTGTYTQEIKRKNGLFCLLDPDQGIVSAFDAEFHRDNWDLFIMKKTEQNKGFKLKYRKNMLGVNWSRNSESLYNRIVPVAKDEEGNDLYLPEIWIDSPQINDYPVTRMEPLTVKGQIGKEKDDTESETWTESDLYSEMRKKANERFTVDSVDQIIEEVTVDFKQRGDTAEYPDLKGFENVALYDIVTAENEEIGLTVQLKVTEIEFDPIKIEITALKMSNVNAKGGKNVTGFNVQNKSISSNKLMDDVAGDILRQVRDIIPEYSDPEAERPSSDIDIIDNLTSTRTDAALSAKQGKLLNDKFGKMALYYNRYKNLTAAANTAQLLETFSKTVYAVAKGTAGGAINYDDLAVVYSRGNSVYVRPAISQNSFFVDVVVMLAP